MVVARTRTVQKFNASPVETRRKFDGGVRGQVHILTVQTSGKGSSERHYSGGNVLAAGSRCKSASDNSSTKGSLVSISGTFLHAQVPSHVVISRCVSQRARQRERLYNTPVGAVHALASAVI